MRAGSIAVIVVAALAAALIGGQSHRRSAGRRTPAPSAGRARSVEPPHLVADLDLAQRIIDDPASSSAQLRSAGELEQLATVALAHASAGQRRATLAALERPAATSMRANLAAAGALAALVTPRRSLPPWKIIDPPAPETLLSYFQRAQRRFGVRWQYLAAIELVETKFGRVDGLSTAGAQGPMQFMPSTWAEYGRGNVHNPRDAIFGAARFLDANGAPGDMARALYHYNPSSDYVTAIETYARSMSADRRAYYGYYQWQVIYAHDRRPLILPVGYPRVRPVPLRLPPLR